MPTTIKGYEILSTIGSGAFGKTSRVRKGGKVYAMKVFKPEAIRTEVDLKRFQRECKALQKIVSDHVVRYHDHGVFDDGGVQTHFIVMDFVEGEDLQRRLQGKTFPRPEAEIRAVLSQVLVALSDIHKHRIVHRDLKPSNIFLTKDGKVKILDFGLVKMLDYTTLTMTGWPLKSASRTGLSPASRTVKSGICWPVCNSSPISVMNSSSAWAASSRVTCSRMRTSGFIVVSRSSCQFISPRPL